MQLLISGAMVMAYWVSGLFFLRFWRRTADRLFAIFAVAFWLLGLQRLVLATHEHSSGDDVWIYLLRLLAFAIVLAGILDKNRAIRSDAPDDARAAGR